MRTFKIILSDDRAQNLVDEIPNEEDHQPVPFLFTMRISPIVFYIQSEDNYDLRLAEQDFDSYPGIEIKEVTGTPWAI